jgi:hypothetical protein
MNDPPPQAEYRATPSIQRYIVLPQTHVGALAFNRHGDHWIDDVVVGAEGVLRMPEIGVEIPLSEIDTDLSFDESDPVAETEDA